MLVPYLPIIFKSWGLSASEIGIIAACKPLIGFSVQPIYGQLADYSRRHSGIHSLCLFMSAIGYGSLYFERERGFGAVLVHVLVTEMFGSGGFFLADNATNYMVQKHLTVNAGSGSRMSYGKVRLWGAVGWGFVFAPLMGLVLTEEKDAKYAPFLAYVILFVISSLIASKMEHFDKAVVEVNVGEVGGDISGGGGDDDDVITLDDEENEHRSMIMTSITRSNNVNNVNNSNKMKRTASFADFNDVSKRTFKIVTEPSAFLVFLLFLLMALSMALTDTYLFLHLESLGAPPILMGLALFFTCVAEVPVFFYEKKIKDWLGIDKSMLLILVCYVFRQLGYAFLKSFGSPWFVLPLQLFHGVTFGLYWSVGVEYSRLLAPTDLRAAVMGFFSGMNSLGAFCGAVFGGRVYDKVGGAGLFLIAAVGNTFLAFAFATKMAFVNHNKKNNNINYDLRTSSPSEINMVGFVALDNREEIVDDYE